MNLDKWVRPNSSGFSHFPELDGLRGLGILTVVMAHMYWCIPGNLPEGGAFVLTVFGISIPFEWVFYTGRGFLKCFFLMSSFLLYLPYARASEQGGTHPAVTKFWKRRALRILPAYYLVIFFFMVICRAMIDGDPPNVVKVVSNMVFLHTFTQWCGKPESSYVPGTWSLAPEVWFYALLPLLAMLSKSRLRFALVMACMLTTGFLYRQTVVPLLRAGLNPIWGDNFFYFVDYFAFGMVAARYHAASQTWGESNLRRLGHIVCVYAGIAVVGWSFNHPPWYPAIVDSEAQQAIGLFLGVLGLIGSDTMVGKLLRSSYLRFTGVISYSIFLINMWLIQYFMYPGLAALNILDERWRCAVLFLLGIPLLVLLGSAMYTWIEKPFLTTGLSVLKTQIRFPLLQPFAWRSQAPVQVNRPARQMSH